MKPSGPGLFVFEEIFDHSFNFSACNWVVHDFYSSWFSLGRLNFSKNLSISSRLSILLPYAAAAAKSLQLCPTVCDPRDGSPPGPAVPGVL